MSSKKYVDEKTNMLILSSNKGDCLKRFAL